MSSCLDFSVGRGIVMYSDERPKISRPLRGGGPARWALFFDWVCALSRPPISVKIVSLGELFSGAYRFRLPWCQRAYAWQTGQAGRLLTNLIDAMRQERQQPYFLGKLMIARHLDGSDTAVVDGHQRTMTLTILFASLRDMEKDAATRARLNAFISGPSGYHLTPQPAIAEFLDAVVQRPGATATLAGDDPAQLSETQRNVLENRDYFRMELDNGALDETERRQLTEFLAERCYAMVCAVYHEDEAWRILQIEEDTRLDFHVTDSAKASLLGIVPPPVRAACSRHWEMCESLLSATDMYALLGHLRILKARKLSDKPVEVDVAQAFRLDRDGEAFFDTTLPSNARRLSAIRRGQIGTGNDRKAIARSTEFLSWISEHSWVPPLMHWIEARGEGGEIAYFVRRLERLVWMMRLSGMDPTKQQRQLLRLLGDIDRKHAVDDMPELKISAKMRTGSLENLRSPTFDQKHYAMRFLRRVSCELGPDPGPRDAVKLTQEHLLPSGWKESSDWRRNFPTREKVREYAHRLGNVSFLSGADNNRADNTDWAQKRPILAASSFILSRNVAGAKDWTPKTIDARTNELIAILFKRWDLKP